MRLPHLGRNLLAFQRFSVAARLVESARAGAVVGKAQMALGLPARSSGGPELRHCCSAELRCHSSSAGGAAALTARTTDGQARISAVSRPRTAQRQRSLVVCAAAKAKIAYECTKCGEVSPQWMGKCPSCTAWNALSQIEVFEEPKAGKAGGGGGIAAARAALPQRRAQNGAGPAADADDGYGGQATPPRMRRGGWVDAAADRPQRVSDVAKRGFGSQWRLPLHGGAGEELSRVLGGGVVPGSMTLVGGDPGVGKSTLLLQLAGMLARIPPLEDAARAGEPVADSRAVLYVSAEESVEQVGSRAERMGLADCEDVWLLSETRVAAILREMRTMRPRALVVDSIQTVYLDDVTGSAGSVSQVRECATALLHVAKRERVPCFLVGHVTKEGSLAGPRVLEHIVDAVLYLEGEKHQAFRLLRGVKNRFGATDEVGVFMMGETGLVPVGNPSALFLSDRSQAGGVSAAVTVEMHGTRPLLAEVQALCSPTHAQAQGGPLRAPNGLPRTRLLQVLAVLAKQAGVKTYGVDVHANVVGGLTLSEPAADLAIAVAVASSVCERPVPPDMAFVGELGLGGELRHVSHLQRRVQEAAKLGFRACVVPKGDKLAAKASGPMQLIPCSTLGAALHACGVLS